MRMLSSTTNLLVVSSAACAFEPCHIHHPPVAFARRSTSIRKGNQAASAASASASGDPSSHPFLSPLPVIPSGPPFHLKRIDHVVIRCRNFPVMFDFYHRVLGCAIDNPREEHLNRFGGALTHLRAGSCYIDLLAYDAKHLTKEGKEATTRMHAGGVGLGNILLDDLNLSSETSTLDHMCLRIEPFDKPQLVNYLEQENVNIVVIGEKRLGADGVGPSVYVRDPEGNVIELKGNPCKDNARNNVKVDETGHEARREIQQTSDCEHMDRPDPQQKPGGENNENESSLLNDTTKEDSSLTSPTTKGSNASNLPMTPCTRICRYNSSFYDGQVCIGCYREAYEIELWQSMTPVQKSMTLLDAIDRYSDNNHGNGRVNNFDGAITIEELKRQYANWSDSAE